MKYSTVIFDFDGTLVDSTAIVSSIFNSLKDEFNLNNLSDQNLKQFKHKSLKDQLAESGLSKMRLPQLIKRVHQEFGKHIHQLEWCDGFPDILEQIHNKQISMGVLSSNNQSNLEAFFALQQIELLDFVHSANKLFSKHKHLKKILNKYQLNPSQVLYVGDEVADIEACQKVGIDIAAVNWGFDSEKLLQKANPTYLLRHSSELLLLLN